MKSYSLAIIDGTGPWGSESYNKEMRYSFCRQLAEQEGGSAHYERGPSMEGYRVHERGERAAAFLQGRRASTERLMLAGYSRGGSAVIMAAEILQKANITVDAMFLFDPVARHMSEGGTVIPANVQRVWIARRRLDRDLIEKYDHTIGFMHMIGHNPMRVFFGMTGTNYAGKGERKEQSFRGSHGAVGGVGSPIVAEDASCQVQVATFMNAAFSDVGLQKTTLISHYGQG